MSKRNNIACLICCIFLPFILAAGGDAPDIQRNMLRLKQMSSEDLYELKQNKEAFDNQSADEQKRMRKLHQQLAQHPKSGRLTQILIQYNLWLAELDGAERSGLAELPVDQKVAKIKEIIQRQAIGEFGMFAKRGLPPEDGPRLEKWMRNFIERRRADILKITRPRNQRNWPAAISGNNANRLARYALITMSDQKRKQIFDEREFESLSRNLSEEAQEILSAAKAEGNELNLLRNWLIALFRSPPKFNQEELQTFFEQELTLRQQAQLDQMIPQNRQAVLVRAYRFFKLGNGNVPENWDPRKFSLKAPIRPPMDKNINLSD